MHKKVGGETTEKWRRYGGRKDEYCTAKSEY
jgi:hypothetical protein